MLKREDLRRPGLDPTMRLFENYSGIGIFIVYV